MRLFYSSFLLSILLVTPNPVSGAQSGNNVAKNGSKASGAGQNALQPTARTGPMIDKVASKNVTALLGKTAYLNCKVKNLGNKTVSWVRHRDIHLLTVGRYTYTSDQRFRAIHHQSSEDWSLQIKYPQHRDTGIYECQISTTPHMSHFIHLNVVEPTTDIIGGPDLYIDRGSTINLTCVVLYSPEPPAYIFWNHNDAIISYDSPRGGVSVITEKGETTTSFLLIQRAKPSDSGRYQCNPSNAQSKSINVHVLNESDELYSSEYPDVTTVTEDPSDSTDETTTDDTDSTTEFTTESTTDSSQIDGSSTTDYDEISSTTDTEDIATETPGECVDGEGCSGGGRRKTMSFLLALMGFLTQFPAAMQHGGQAHHRSSHLYCLIFCVCLLLFST